MAVSPGRNLSAPIALNEYGDTEKFDTTWLWNFKSPGCPQQDSTLVGYIGKGSYAKVTPNSATVQGMVMRISGARILAAGNMWSRSAVVRLQLSADGAGGCDPVISNAYLIPDLIPPVSRFRSDMVDFPAWQSLLTGTEISATRVVETLALLIQRWVNWPVQFAGSEQGANAREFVAVFETRQARAGLRAGEVAVELLNALCREDLDRLRNIFDQAFDAYRESTLDVTPTVDTLAIAKRAQHREIPWSTVPGTNYIKLGYGRHSNILLGSESTNTSSMGRMLAKNKAATNAILVAGGLPVAVQRLARSVEEARDAARWIGFPVVVKPASGNMGRSVTVGVQNEVQLLEAYEHASRVSARIVVEAILKGEEYRLLVVGGKFFAASCRRPAHVRGDGTSTVQQLVDRENLNPERHAGMHSSLKPLPVDKMARSCLAEQRLSLDAVPEKDQIVLLRRVSNVSQGGTAVDMTEAVHPSIREVAERAAALLGIDVCGVDFITTAIDRPFWETGGAICEVNTRPMLGLHLAVVEGTRRDAADAVVEMLYPKSSPSRIPLVVVLTVADGDPLANAIRASADASGQRVGLASIEGTLIGKQTCRMRFGDHLDGIEAIVADATLDAGIVVVSPEEVLNKGVGLDRIDIAILPSGNSSAPAKQAREILTRIADGRVIAAKDPAVVDKTLQIIGRPADNRQRGESTKQPRVAAAPAARPCRRAGRFSTGESANFTVLLVGDVGFGESYLEYPRMASLRESLAIKGHRYSLARVSDVLASGDLTIGNLEVPLAATPDPSLKGRKNYLGSSDPDETAAALVEAGFNAVSLANNHSLDCGESGLRETIRRLRAAGITPFGAGVDLAEAARPLVKTITVGGVERTIVIWACFEFREKYDKQFRWYAGNTKPGINCITPEAIATQIADLRRTLPSPFFIAYPHWGTDYTSTEPYQREYARHLAAAGVDLIVGHGAHTIQGMEIVSGRPVLFGLGNFVWNTPGRFSKTRAAPYGLAVALRFESRANDGLSLSVRMYPLLTDNDITHFQNRPVSEEEFPQAFAVLTKRYDGGRDLLTGVDDLGSFVELNLEATSGA